MEVLKDKGNIGKRIFSLVLVCMLAISLIGNGLSVYASPVIVTEEQEIENAEASTKIEEIKENALFAQSAVLMDAESGRVLYAKNSEDILPMASTTKIMTLLVALEYGNMEDLVTVSSYAASMPDVQLNIREGEQYYLKDLLYSLMLESHNDSAVAIAECVAGSTENFAQKMNLKAKEIGCENTTFITPNGLDATAVMTDTDGAKREVMHSTTAQDLAKIMSYCVTESAYKDTFLEITRTPTYTFSDLEGKRTFTCRNHNSFLYMMEGALSGKTGFTGKAGYCYVGALKRDNKTLVVALLACGWPNNRNYKWKDTTKLMEYGLENYEYSTFANAASDIPKSGQIQVFGGQTHKIGENAYVEWKVQDATLDSIMSNKIGTGKDSQIKAIVKEGILLRKDEEIDLEWRVSDNLQAPVSAGDSVGYIRYLINGDVYKEEKLILQSSVDLIDYAWCLKKTIERFLFF